MGDSTGRLVRVGDAGLADALRYLHELEWDAVYPRSARAAGELVAGAAIETETGAHPVAAGADDQRVDAVGAARSGAVSRTVEPPAIHAEVARSAEERASALAAVAAEASRCERCELARGRTHVVFASGDPDADLMIIGEGPGAQEDRQ